MATKKINLEEAMAKFKTIFRANKEEDEQTEETEE